MSKFCSYKFVAGPNKGKQCTTFLRGNKEFCYKHKKFRKEGNVLAQEQTPVEPQKEIAKVEAEPVKPAANNTEKGVIRLPLDVESSDSSDFSVSSSDYSTSDSD